MVQAKTEEATKDAIPASESIDSTRLKTELRRILALITKAREHVGSEIPMRFAEAKSEPDMGVYRSHIAAMVLMDTGVHALNEIISKTTDSKSPESWLESKLESARLHISGAEDEWTEMRRVLYDNASKPQPLPLGAKLVLALTLLEKALEEIVVLRDDPPMEGDAR
jgi:hypothetical protein